MPAPSLWCGVAFAVIGTVTILPVAALFIATMRYLVDVIGGVTLFCTWTAFWWYTMARRSRWLRYGVAILSVALGTATIAIGCLLGYEGYNGQFRSHNPKLHERIVKVLSRCE
jgi:hypothetical protein